MLVAHRRDDDADVAADVVDVPRPQRQQQGLPVLGHPQGPACLAPRQEVPAVQQGDRSDPNRLAPPRGRTYVALGGELARLHDEVEHGRHAQVGTGDRRPPHRPAGPHERDVRRLRAHLQQPCVRPRPVEHDDVGAVGPQRQP